MSEFFNIFDASSPLIVVVDEDRDGMEKVLESVLSHLDPQARVSSNLAEVSHELLQRSEGKSKNDNTIIAQKIISEDDPDKYDFIHMDNIATQGGRYNVGAVVGLVSCRNIDDILTNSKSMEKFALSKATMVESDSLMTYLSE